MIDTQRSNFLVITLRPLKIDCILHFSNTVCVKRNAHLIPISFVAILGEGGQKFRWNVCHHDRLTGVVGAPEPSVAFLLGGSVFHLHSFQN